MYCQAGETARVTFPDGVKKDFDAPIEIKCEDGVLSPERVGVDIHVRGIITNIESGNQRTRDYFSYDYAGYSPHTPVLSTREFYDATSGFTFFEILAYPSDLPAANPIWFRMGSYVADYQTASFSIISIKKKFNPGAGEDLKKKIITVSRNGLQILQNQYDSCGFSVECVEPCPPNTIGCGDCCLDCAPIFNQLSALTKKVLSIK